MVLSTSPSLEQRRVAFFVPPWDAQ
ncbi:hypothetical protein LINPERPRIM_LOCUS30977 [Linum perenne]